MIHRERQTRRVAILAFVTMAAEIAVGSWTGSLALLVDGWHMASHVCALGLASVAYWYARRAESAGRFAFGPGKVATLAGYTNAVVLAIVAVLMFAEGVERLAAPAQVRFTEALPVAVIGLLVNLVSAWILSPEEEHHEPHDHHHDHNLRSAYLHVLSDILTSVLAIGALTLGYFTGIARFDAVVALVGAVVILWWAIGLMRRSAPELIDLRLDSETVTSLRAALEADGHASVNELKLWPLGSGRKACHLVLVSLEPRPAEVYRQLVLEVARFDHLSIEIQRGTAPHLRSV